MFTGKDHNDEFYLDADGRTRTRTNRSGGVQGGISNGENIVIRVAFKPTSTIGQEQQTVSRQGKTQDITKLRSVYLHCGVVQVKRRRFAVKADMTRVYFLAPFLW